MAVAKTYEKMEILCEPFEESGRLYVNVATAKGAKKVRWYSDAEYKRMYPEAASTEIVTNDIMDFNARHAFGFDEKGYILLYKGKNVEKWVEKDHTNIWYNLTFGYYTPSKFDPPPKTDEGIEAIKLEWATVQDHDNRMRPHEEVKKIVDKLLFDETASNYQGEVNEWLQKEVTVKEKNDQENHFGTKHTYMLEDKDNNIYVWETGAKDYSVGQIINLKMKVKEHKEIQGNKATIVWYCKEV